MPDETPDPVPQTDAAPPPSLEAQLTTATTDTAAIPDVPTSAVVTTQGGAAVTTAPQPEQGEGWQGVRDYAKSRGVDLPYADDGAALESLLTAYRNVGRRDYYADLGQKFAPQAHQIQQYLAEQTRAAAAPQAPPAWQPPEFNKAWLAQVEKDPDTGAVRSKAGYDPAIAEKVTAYANWRDEFLDDPAKVVGPLVEQRAQQLIEQKFAQYQQQSVAADIVRGHSPWMYVRDAQGRPQLTPEGAVYASAVRQYAGSVSDPRQLDGIALAITQNAVYGQRAAAAAPPAVSAAAAPTASSVGGSNARPGSSAPTSPPPSMNGMSLRQRLQTATKRFEFSDVS